MIKKEDKWYEPFASKEEFYFNEWVFEMKKAGYISEYEYQPGPYTLVEPVYVDVLKKFKRKEDSHEPKRILHGAEYTPDWRIKFTTAFYDDFRLLVEDINDSCYWETKTPLFIESGNWWFVDIKGGASRFDDGRSFSLTQKMFYETHGYYVQKVPITTDKKSFFNKTFTPRRFLKTDKSNKLRSINYDNRNLKDFVIANERK